MGNGKIFGMFVQSTDNGSSVTSKVKRYPTYQDMVNDKEPAVYAIVDENNTVYHRVDNEWIVGFPVLTDEKEYTAFEVYPTSVAMAPGTFNHLGCTNAIEIAAEDTHHMDIRSKLSLEEQDIVIDWGDGSFLNFKNGTNEDFIAAGEEGQYRYLVRHKYTVPDKPYIIKVYGSTYYSIMSETPTSYIDDGSGETKTYLKHNLMSRVFDFDLPIAKCVTNTASFCRTARRLLKVDMSKTDIKRRSVNWNLTFSGAVNMTSCMGWGGGPYDNILACSEIFGSCGAMVETDFVLPRCVSSASTMKSAYLKCAGLTANVIDFLPSTNFFLTTIAAGGMFQNTNVVIDETTADAVAAKLWNNPNVTWTSTANAFKGCPESTRAFVPTTWGGTKIEETAE